jgi:hypothetical protein
MRRVFPFAVVAAGLTSTVAWAQGPAFAPPPPDSGVVSSGTRPEEPFAELPILTWQEEAELNSTVRQVLFNAYLPLLARPTNFRGVHDDAVPNQVPDFDYMRADVKKQLLDRAASVDQQRRAHGALPDAEINHLISKKVAFRPEELEPLLTNTPRIDDLQVVVKRVQPLGNDVYRVDFEVKTKVGAIVETTTFETVDIVRRGSSWLLPTRVPWPSSRATATAPPAGSILSPWRASSSPSPSTP